MSSIWCCVDAKTSSLLNKPEVEPKPECFVGFESLGGGEYDGVGRGVL